MQKTSLLWLDIVEKCIRERRSVRIYRDKKVESDKITRILEAGNWAPSAGNLHSRRFIVVQSPGGRRKVIDSVESNKIKEMGKNKLVKVPVFIIICADFKKCRGKYKGKRGRLFAIQDTAVSAQNMAIMAHALGLGTCWIGNFNESKIISAFNIRKGLYPSVILALGYPEYIPPPPKRYSISEIAEFDSEANPGNSIYKPQES